MFMQLAPCVLCSYCQASISCWDVHLDHNDSVQSAESRHIAMDRG